jgi:hypothetical protein
MHDAHDAAAAIRSVGGRTSPGSLDEAPGRIFGVRPGCLCVLERLESRTNLITKLLEPGFRLWFQGGVWWFHGV